MKTDALPEAPKLAVEPPGPHRLWVPVLNWSAREKVIGVACAEPARARSRATLERHRPERILELVRRVERIDRNIFVSFFESGFAR